ncbi:MAG TPA: ribonuclease H-like domain-containing protein [Solirubrobacteraceae bacterium]
MSVDADANGRARVWRRLGERVELTEHAFPNWFLTTNLDLLAHLPAERHAAEWLGQSHGQLVLREPMAVVELDSPPTDDAYRYLVLTSNLGEVETALLETANKRDGEDARSLADLRGLLLIWSPLEQFLALTGRTYFKRMPFESLRRLQFDLETTGLNEDRDRIFMISMRDSTGWRECLDTSAMSEPEMLGRFVDLVGKRDPDTLENHNIFGFDLSFLAKRAARLGVPLALGRDGTEPWLETDVFDGGDRPEPFLRWRVVGREVVDTQHAVRRYGLDAPDMRRHGLKEAARYFGFARADREYVPGAEIWATFRTDPDRVRRYAADDVDEVDGLSQRLLPALFGLTSRLPRSYEEVAADTGATSLWELLLVRAYLHEGRAIAAPTPRMQRAAGQARSELFVSGLVGESARAAASALLPSVLAERDIAAANDDLRVMPRLVRDLLDQRGDHAAQRLAAAAQAYLASAGLFGDPQAASEAASAARDSLDRLIGDLRARGATPIEVDGEQVLFGVGPAWTSVSEDAVRDAARGYLPVGVDLEFRARYAALYLRAPGTSITLGEDGAVTLVGPAFRPGRLERFGDAFMHRAAACLLRSDIHGLRGVFLETVALLRGGGIALDDLCVQVTLHKSPAQYRRGGTHEEPYEVLLGAGVRSWRVGQRIRYFRARGYETRLLVEGSELSAADADTEYYVQRLSGLYCQQFAQAFRREDFARVFRMPSGPGPFEPPREGEFADVRPIHTPLA